MGASVVSCGKYLPAEMTKRVKIQNATRISDGQGGFTETWPDVATVWAKIEPIKAYERMQAMQMQTPVTHKIVMRYRGDVTSASRFNYQERILWAKEVINVDENNQFLEIKAIERS